MTNPNKFIKLWVANLIRLSPVYRIVSTLNLVFILGLMTLTAFGVRTWTHPEYPLRVDGTNLVGTPRELAPLIVTRKSTPPQSVNEVAQKNLFRQERIEYRPPPPPQSKVAKAPPKPALPAPELSLRGVMLLNGTKIAILEGTYPVLTGNKTEKKPIKRKGYRLGERIGDFEITQIEKRSVTLNNPIGQVLTVKLKRTTPVMNKTRKRKARIISTRPTAKKVEKSRQPASALAPHISGRRTAPPPLHISGR
ncbi:MAG: hypothetical protein IID18_02020 [Nitrospinae bacterium]|nr:hypothetical protein [Nitrospinota bacterium]